MAHGQALLPPEQQGQRGGGDRVLRHVGLNPLERIVAIGDGHVAQVEPAAVDRPAGDADDDEGQAGQGVLRSHPSGTGIPSWRGTFTAPLRSGVMSLSSSASSASALRDSRIARRYPAHVEDSRVTRWADSGAMALTGLPDHPLGPPAGLVEGIDRLARSFPGLDALALLGERAALMGLWRRGATSCGGSCRLLPSGDGFMAVSLPRAEDMEAVPAWLELDEVPGVGPGHVVRRRLAPAAR